jgi:hypothetical protein
MDSPGGGGERPEKKRLGMVIKLLLLIRNNIANISIRIITPLLALSSAGMAVLNYK